MTSAAATPDDPSRAGDDDAVGDDQVDQAYENLGRVYDYYHDTFGWDSYDGEGGPVIGVVNFCEGGTSSGVSSGTASGSCSRRAPATRSTPRPTSSRTA